jgi:DNA-directed RNA polymerase subunit alpha
MIDDNKFTVKTVDTSDDGTYGKFVCEPLDRGYGITLGNSLRRVLLSSLDGVAITSIKIDGVLHEFSTISGVREDVSEIILNLKQVRLKFNNKEVDEIDITVDVAGEREFTAKDLEVNSDIEILNPDLHIATLDADADIHMQCHIERGKGYVPSTKNKKDTDMIGVIPIDSLFSPIIRTNYEVGNIRVGNEMDYDSLTLEVTTDRSITADNAVAKAASIIIGYLNYFQSIASDQDVNETLPPFVSGEGDDVVEEITQDKADLSQEKIDVLDLSVRASNCLKRANIYTLGDLIERTEDDLSKIRNLGKKSVDEIIEKLKDYGCDLKSNEQ